jgi:hypothetical protein
LLENRRRLIEILPDDTEYHASYSASYTLKTIPNMAEAVAAVGLAAAIFQFVAFSGKIIKRLDEFASATDNIPATFWDIKVQLPLLIDTLQRNQSQAEEGPIGETAAIALKAVIEWGLEEAQTLMKILDRALPKDASSSFEIWVQALKSLACDKKVQESIDRLIRHLQILNLSQSMSSCDTVEKLSQQLMKSSSISSTTSPNYSFGLNIGSAPQIHDGAFIGRRSELKHLQDWLSPQSTTPTQKIVSIIGMGGLGRTQLSVAFARQYGRDYSSVFWVNAKDEATLKQSFVSLADIILDKVNNSSMTDAADEDHVLHQVRQWFSQQDNDQWLLLFDNYDDPKLPGVNSPTGYDIRQYFLFRAQGAILIASRSRRLKFARELELRKLDDEEQNLEILSNRSGRDLRNRKLLLQMVCLPAQWREWSDTGSVPWQIDHWAWRSCRCCHSPLAPLGRGWSFCGWQLIHWYSDPDAVKLVERLYGLPLALATAGVYLSQTSESLGEYLDAYERYWQDLSDNAEELLEYEDRTLFSTLNLSLDRVRARDPHAAELMRFLAYFGANRIEFELFQPALHTIALVIGIDWKQRAFSASDGPITGILTCRGFSQRLQFTQLRSW